jgi:hypothetical protein
MSHTLPPCSTFIYIEWCQLTVPSIVDNCDACDAEVEWEVDEDLQHSSCSKCGTRHIVSVHEQMVSEHEEKTEAERQEMFNRLNEWMDERRIGRQ